MLLEYYIKWSGLQGFLNPDGDVALYELLSLGPAATGHDIKRAFRKASLAYHPDKLAQRGQVLTAEDTAKFSRIKEAYDMLSDPRKRRLYDTFGEDGARLIADGPAKANLDPQVMEQKCMRASTGTRCNVFSRIVFVLALVLLWLCLVAAKADDDGGVGPWAAAWAPLWVLDSVLLAFYLGLLREGTEPRPDWVEPDEWNDPFPMRDRALSLGYFVLLVVFQALLVAKLDGATFPWLVAFAPLALWELAGAVEDAKAACAALPPPPSVDVEDGTAEQAEVEAAMKYEVAKDRRADARGGLVALALRFLWYALVVAQLSGAEDDADGRQPMSWWLVFLPAWLYAAGQLAAAVLAARSSRALARELEVREILTDPTIPEEMKQQAQMRLAVEHSKVASAGCNVACTLLLGCLLVARCAGDGDYSVFVILIPAFVLSCCGCCLAFLLICCLRDPESLGLEPDDGLNDEREGLRPGGQGGGGQGGDGHDAVVFDQPKASSVTTPLRNDSPDRIGGGYEATGTSGGATVLSPPSEDEGEDVLSSGDVVLDVPPVRESDDLD